MPAKMDDFWFAAEGGLRLHALRASPGMKKHLPAICLPGVSRTAEDFRTLLDAFANDGRQPRPAFALDSRGRGLSERDKNPANYSLAVELGDLIAFLRAAKIERAIFVGTSRGGILTMLLATVMPKAIAGAVLNDVGPVLDIEGLLRIKSYVGKIPPPRSWPEAVASLKTIMGAHFPAFTESDWESYARRTWDECFDLRSDPAIARTFDAVSPSSPPPALWPQYAALAKVAPILVLRGEHSDLLSRLTVEEMRRRAPLASSTEIPGQGHAPALESPEIVRKILDFASRCDSGE